MLEAEIEIIELDGEPYEIIDRIEYDGNTYIAITPYIDDEEDVLPETGTLETEFTILKEVLSEGGDEENEDEHELQDIEDEKLYQEIGALFLAKFETLFDDEDDDGYADD
ncbi:MAG: DUF1292 domain-containing protein [Oscillospiraceae bacterium]|jgi:hypothetical protein|nr:DUF1292 domain-containing protein [Oscillospiraceae bacterium]